MPSKKHSLIQKWILIALVRYEPEYVVFGELSLRLGDLDVTPDLCLYRQENVDLEHEEIRMTEPPILAVEILSPTQSTQTLVDKVEGLLAAGVQSCWLVQPALDLVTVFTEGMEKTTYTEGTITDPATGIEVALADIFQTAA